MLLVASIFIVTLAGIVRGITGFGGALFMVPVLNLIVEPIEAVLYAFTPEALAIVVMLPKIWNKLDWCVLCAICFPALLTVPFGSMLLVWLDPHSLRTIISAVVIMFSLLMLTGLCYEGRPRIVTSACMGGIGGFMCGSTAMGGPPVILYLLSGTASAATTRGNLAAYVSVVSLCALIFPFLNGLITASVVQTSALQAPPYLLGTVLETVMNLWVRKSLIRLGSKASALAALAIGIAAEAFASSSPATEWSYCAAAPTLHETMKAAIRRVVHNSL